MGAIAAGHAIDLHTHSLRSDGALSPADLVKRGAARGVKIQALSDHDTLAGVAEAAATGGELGVRIIAATELNTESEWGDAHILGHFIDPADSALEARLRWLRENRGKRIELMVEKESSWLGNDLNVRSYDDAFRTLIAKDSPAYVPRIGLDPFEAVALVRKHGGVPSLAHPGTVVGLDALLPKLVAAGLAGIEAYYGEHSPEMTARCLARAREFDLVPTGGSDFHGRGEHGADLGGVFVPAETIEHLESRRNRA